MRLILVTMDQKDHLGVLCSRFYGISEEYDVAEISL
jgi:hypothetical protein